jgi:hypothetical protein
MDWLEASAAAVHCGNAAKAALLAVGTVNVLVSEGFTAQQAGDIPTVTDEVTLMPRCPLPGSC